MDDPAAPQFPNDPRLTARFNDIDKVIPTTKVYMNKFRGMTLEEQWAEFQKLSVERAKITGRMVFLQQIMPDADQMEAAMCDKMAKMLRPSPSKPAAASVFEPDHDDENCEEEVVEEVKVPKKRVVKKPVKAVPLPDEDDEPVEPVKTPKKTKKTAK